jgi:2-dehydro-3-deoxygluconokinase
MRPDPGFSVKRGVCEPVPMTIDLLCMGEPMLEFSQLPPDADGRVLYLEGHGGDTSNAAVAAARQGARVGYITAIGEDMAGDSFLRLWAREGVDASTVVRMADAQTGVYFITHEATPENGGGHRFHHYRTGSAASRFGPEDVPEAAISAAKILYVSGISQGISAIAADAVFRAIEVAKAAGAAVAYDTNYRPKLWPPARAAAVMHAAMARVDYAFPGMEDAAALTALREPDAIADFYLRLGAKMVVLKMGADGALLATGAARRRIPPVGVRLVDAAGAGDTFCGAFLARVLAGDHALAAAFYANAAAALACEGLGCVAPIPMAARVLEFLDADAAAG